MKMRCKTPFGARKRDTTAPKDLDDLLNEGYRGYGKSHRTLAGARRAARDAREVLTGDVRFRIGRDRHDDVSPYHVMFKD